MRLFGARSGAAAAMVAVLGLSSGVAAQPAPAAPARTPKPATEAAKAEAARLIEAAGATELFEDASEGDVPGVRHLRSGLVCTFKPDGGGGTIRIYDRGPTRGDDVSCGHTRLGITTTLYATRFPPDLSAQDLLDSAVAAIRQRYPDAKPFAGKVADATLDTKGRPDWSEQLRARFVVKLDGVASLTKVNLVKVGPWTIKQRATGPIDPEMRTDLESEMTFALALLRLDGPARTPPAQ